MARGAGRAAGATRCARSWARYRCDACLSGELSGLWGVDSGARKLPLRLCFGQNPATINSALLSHFLSFGDFFLGALAVEMRAFNPSLLLAPLERK